MEKLITIEALGKLLDDTDTCGITIRSDAFLTNVLATHTRPAPVSQTLSYDDVYVYVVDSKGKKSRATMSKNAKVYLVDSTATQSEEIAQCEELLAKRVGSIEYWTMQRDRAAEAVEAHTKAADELRRRLEVLKGKTPAKPARKNKRK